MRHNRATAGPYLATTISVEASSNVCTLANQNSSNIDVT